MPGVPRLPNRLAEHGFRQVKKAMYVGKGRMREEDTAPQDGTDSTDRSNRSRCHGRHLFLEARQVPFLLPDRRGADVPSLKEEAPESCMIDGTQC
jgi:hypothetical protein